jgi:hypothetical protein
MNCLRWRMRFKLTLTQTRKRPFAARVKSGLQKPFAPSQPQSNNPARRYAMSVFEKQLRSMVSKELCGTAEEIGVLIERLTEALGLAIAVASRGDTEAADTLLTGAEGYLAESVAHHRKLAEFMATVKRRPQ